jgi:undecaprenyl diphosphate synthase
LADTSSSKPVIPHHIAIVMDGNGRWAKKRFLPRLAGHKQGVDALRQCVKDCTARGVRVLTVFAFSSENWNRPAEEVSGLMEILGMALMREVKDLAANGVRLYFVGDRTALSSKLISALDGAEAQTAHCDKLVLNVCLNYGGRWDIADAASRLALQGIAITPDSLNAALSLSHVPDPDLFIRTGGEQRLSNFLLWQSAYSELYFSNKLWPDFDAAELDQAIGAYSGRERRFGKTSEQLESPHAH